MNHCGQGLVSHLLVFSLLSAGSVAVTAQEVSPQERASAWLADIRLPTKNYVSDGSFEGGGQGWGWFMHKAGGLDNKVAARGKTSFRMGADDPNRHFYYHQYNVSLVTGKTYTLSAMVKAEDLVDLPGDSMSRGVLFLTNYGWTKSASLKPPRGTYDWTRVTETFVAPPTQPRPDGKPTYTLTAYWPPKTVGQFWLDDVQIEEGTDATDYTDVFVGDGMIALEKLKTLAQIVLSTEQALTRFGKASIIQSLSAKLNGILARTALIRDELKIFDQLATSTRAGLVKRVDSIAGELAGIRTLIWTGPAHIPLSEVRLPSHLPEKRVIELMCLKGQHHDMSINIANMTSSGYPVRVSASTLYNTPFALSVPSSQWITFYSVPRMRGFSKPTEMFTDALPQVTNGGLIYVEPATIGQTVLSVDTTGLVPGEYVGEIAMASLVDASNLQTISVRLNVLPAAILPLRNVDIAECFGHTDYAWEAMLQLGVNTFDIDSSWIDADFGDDGNVSRIDFTRVDRKIRRAIADVGNARFLILSGQGVLTTIRSRTGWQPDDPRIETAFKGWVKALVDNLRDLDVTADRLIMETYDEPGPGDYAAGTTMARWVDEVDSAIQTHFYASGIDNNDAWRKNALAHDIVAPGVSVCTRDNMKFVKALGKKLWVYDCQADGETFHPIAYYRLMPWTCRAYGIAGWGHFSWFSSSHGLGRGYRPWMGVETQNLVYPDADGTGMVISRRFLAMRAGTEDYQVLDALERAIANVSTANDQRAEQVATFIAGAYDWALSLSPRKKRYQTHISPDVPPDLLDRLRDEAIERIRSVLPRDTLLETTLADKDGAAIVSVNTPSEGTVRIRYLTNGMLAWNVLTQRVMPGQTSIVLKGRGEVNRCLVEFTSETGMVLVGSPLIIPQISVDSTHPGYSPLNLNDGIRAEAVKFEQKYAWISSGQAVEHWVEMNLGWARQVSTVNLFWMTFTGLPQKTMIQYLDKSSAWKPVSATPAWRPARGPVERITFTPVTTDKLRILMAPKGGGVGGSALMGLSEVEVR